MAADQFNYMNRLPDASFIISNLFPTKCFVLYRLVKCGLCSIAILSLISNYNCKIFTVENLAKPFKHCERICTFADLYKLFPDVVVRINLSQNQDLYPLNMM